MKLLRISLLDIVMALLCLPVVMIILVGPIVGATAARAQLQGWELSSAEATIKEKFTRNTKGSLSHYFRVDYKPPEQVNMIHTSLSVTEDAFDTLYQGDSFQVFYYASKPSVLYDSPSRTQRASRFFKVGISSLALFGVLALWRYFARRRMRWLQD